MLRPREIALATKETDHWCSPRWVTELLPKVDLDPCSNAGSTVSARVRLTKDDEVNGLNGRWGDFGTTVYLNCPYSDPLPWAKKTAEFVADGGTVWALVKWDPSTKWWRAFHREPCRVYPFRRRIQYADPNGGKSITPPWNSALLLITRDYQVTVPGKLKTHLIGELTPFPWAHEEPPQHGDFYSRDGRKRKLTEEQAAEVVALGKELSAVQIAERLGVHPKTIRDILQGRTWRHRVDAEQSV